MIQLDVIQGGESWHKARAKYPRTASLAPAIMGCSKNKTRTDAVRLLASGVEREFSQWVQDNLLDRGHLIEGYAKPLAEKIIGKKLYPITAISDDEYLLASFDGLSADDEDAWECKSWNEQKAVDVRAGRIPEEDYWQVVQQLAIGAARCLYMVTDGAEEKTVYCWLKRDDIGADINRLISGWSQMDKDVANYQHVEHAEKPKAEVVIDLPALFVHARGEITTHNMDEFGKALVARLAEVRAIALVTDQDFSNAKEAAKKFRETAKAIAKSKEQMLAQTETIGEAARKMDAWAKDLNATALQLEKDVEREDLAKKESIVLGAKSLLADHIAALENEIKPIRLNLAAPNFAEAIKGKRNYASMQDAVDTALAGAKIEADAAAKDIRAKLAWCRDHVQEFGRYEMLFADRRVIFQKPMDDFQLTITSRIDSAKRAEAERLEAERARIAAEEKVKAEREAAAKLAAEEARIRAEERAKAEDEAEANRVAAMIKGASKLPRLPQERVSEIMKSFPQHGEELRGKTTEATHADRERAGMPQAPADSTPPILLEERPTRAQLIAMVAGFCAVDLATAEGWLISEFAEEVMKEAA